MMASNLLASTFGREWRLCDSVMVVVRGPITSFIFKVYKGCTNIDLYSALHKLQIQLDHCLLYLEMEIFWSDHYCPMSISAQRRSGKSWKGLLFFSFQYDFKYRNYSNHCKFSQYLYTVASNFFLAPRLVLS